MIRNFFRVIAGMMKGQRHSPANFFLILSTVMGIFFPLNTDMMKFQRQPPKSFFSSSPR